MCFNLHFLTTLKSPSFILILFLEVILSAQKELQPITAGVGPQRVTPWKVSRRPLYRERDNHSPPGHPEKFKSLFLNPLTDDTKSSLKSFASSPHQVLKTGPDITALLNFFFFFLDRTKPRQVWSQVSDLVWHRALRKPRVTSTDVGLLRSHPEHILSHSTTPDSNHHSHMLNPNPQPNLNLGLIVP